MSNASGGEDALEVVAEGVRVRKGFEAEEFPVPAIKFAITSEREEPVTVRIADRIPEEFSMDGVGFHPDYESENWTAYQDHRVEYERTLQPDEKVVTVYGIRAGTMDEVQQFLVEPGVKTVQPTGDDRGEGSETVDNTIQDIAPKESTEVVREYISGDREAIPGMDEDGGAVASEPAEAAGPADVGAEEAVAGGEESGDDLDGLGLDDDDAENLLGEIDFDEEPSSGDEPEPADDDAEPLELGLDEEADAPAEPEEADSEVDEMAEDIDFGEVPDTNDLEGDDQAADAEDGIAEVDDAAPETPSVEASSEPAAVDEEDHADETVGDDDIGLDLGEADAREGETVVPDGESVQGAPDVPADDAVTESTETAEPSTGLADDEDPGMETGASAPGPGADGDERGSAPSVGGADDDERGSAPSVGGADGGASAGNDESVDVAAPDDGSPGASASTGDGSVAAALASEIREGSVPDEDLDDLRDALGVADEPDTPRSLQARIEHIESRVDEFDAYTGAIKEFIDDNGTANDIVEEMNGRIDDLASDVERIAGDVDEHDDALGDARSRFDAFEDEAESRFEDLESSVERLDDVVEDTDELADTVDELSSTVGGLDDQFSSLDSRVGRLVDSVEGLESDLASLEESVEAVERRTDEVQEELSSDGEQLQAEVESLRNDLQSIEGDVREIAEWRSQLGEMFK